MLITRIYIDNLYSFNNFEMDLTYNRCYKSNVENSIMNYNIPNIHVKKLCIIMGTNGSGKSALCNIIYLLVKGLELGKEYLKNKLFNYTKEKRAEIVFEFIIYNIMYSLDIEISDKHLFCNLHYVELDKKDNIRIARKKLYSNKHKTKDDIILDPYVYLFKDNNKHIFFKDDRLISDKNIFLEKDIFNNIIKTIDSSLDIYFVYNDNKLNLFELFKGCYISFKSSYDNCFIDYQGNITNKHLLSPAIIDGINLSFILSCISNDTAENYVLDNIASNLHPHLERIILGLLICYSDRKKQLFYVTNNNDILDMDLPKDSIYTLSSNPNTELLDELLFDERYKNV